MPPLGAILAIIPKVKKFATSLEQSPVRYFWRGRVVVPFYDPRPLSEVASFVAKLPDWCNPVYGQTLQDLAVAVETVYPYTWARKSCLTAIREKGERARLHRDLMGIILRHNPTAFIFLNRSWRALADELALSWFDGKRLVDMFCDHVKNQPEHDLPLTWALPRAWKVLRQLIAQEPTRNVQLESKEGEQRTLVFTQAICDPKQANLLLNVLEIINLLRLLPKCFEQIQEAVLEKVFMSPKGLTCQVDIGNNEKLVASLHELRSCSFYNRNFSNCNLTAFPICSFPHYTELCLNLSHNKLTHVLCEFEDYFYLDLSYNQITAVGHFRNVATLSILGNPIPLREVAVRCENVNFCVETNKALCRELFGMEQVPLRLSPPELAAHADQGLEGIYQRLPLPDKPVFKRPAQLRRWFATLTPEMIAQVKVLNLSNLFLVVLPVEITLFTELEELTVSKTTFDSDPRLRFPYSTFKKLRKFNKSYGLDFFKPLAS